MTPRRQRALLIGGALILLAVAATLVVNAFRSNLVFFYTPSDIVAGKAPADSTFRVGGMVETGSVLRGSDGVSVSFRVTDTQHTVKVSYRGVLPDLFREGKGVVAQGRSGPDGFIASEVLAKHDENYMPPEAAEAIKRAGAAASHPGMKP